MNINFLKMSWLWFGPVTLLLFSVGVIVLSRLVPGYNQIQQTVSEIGEMESPIRIPFTILLCVIGICLILFASAIRKISGYERRLHLVAYLLGCMGISVSGVGIFAFPHPLHNVFGISELIGYQAPLALAITWRKNLEERKLVIWSWIFYIAIVLGLVINMSPLLSKQLWSYIKPVHGLAQRFLFLSFFSWCAVVGTMLQIKKSAIRNRNYF